MAYTTMTMEEYNEAVQALPADRLSELVGMSPGGVAGVLGITRQGVHNAIKRHSLNAYRLTHRKKVVAIIVPDAEVSRYRRHHLKKAS